MLALVVMVMDKVVEALADIAPLIIVKPQVAVQPQKLLLTLYLLQIIV